MTFIIHAAKQVRILSLIKFESDVSKNAHFNYAEKGYTLQKQNS